MPEPAAAPLLTTSFSASVCSPCSIEVQGEAVSAKVVAALGMLVALASVLRFLETAIPGPGGFSPVFVPIILAGYVFGSRFGFLMGAMTLLVSALLTGGVGPWLPYQMFVCGLGRIQRWLAPLSSSTAPAGRFAQRLWRSWGMSYTASSPTSTSGRSSSATQP
jgi:hypothetical protein